VTATDAPDGDRKGEISGDEEAGACDDRTQSSNKTCNSHGVSPATGRAIDRWIAAGTLDQPLACLWARRVLVC
jgi:hypothetical protein